MRDCHIDCDMTNKTRTHPTNAALLDSFAVMKPEHLEAGGNRWERGGLSGTGTPSKIIPMLSHK